MSTLVRLPNNIIVHSFSIIGTNTTIYEAYEPSSYTGNHSIIQRFNDQVYGNIASRRTGERAYNVNDAIQYILDAFPHLESLEYGVDNTLGRIEVIE